MKLYSIAALAFIAVAAEGCSLEERCGFYKFTVEQYGERGGDREQMWIGGFAVPYLRKRCATVGITF